jgi:hypothetical protein
MHPTIRLKLATRRQAVWFRNHGIFDGNTTASQIQGRVHIFFMFFSRSQAREHVSRPCFLIESTGNAPNLRLAGSLSARCEDRTAGLRGRRRRALAAGAREAAGHKEDLAGLAVGSETSGRCSKPMAERDAGRLPSQ